VTQRIDVTLDELHRLYARIDKKQLEDGDWPVVSALVAKLIAHEQGRIDRVIAKIAADAAAAAAAAKGASNKIVDVEPAAPELTPTNEEPQDGSPVATSTDQARESAASGEAPKPTGEATPKAPDTTNKKGKGGKNGHGRNGASAYTQAKHIFHTLMSGIVGALCDCKDGYMTRYREKVVIRIVGQPLFAAVIHHFEQARCKMCGKIIRAPGSAEVLEGIGTSYVTYGWSACAMLIVMHYFAGAPFKRIESLHAGWGVPLADANQWMVVDQSDDHLQPLYNAMEIHGIREALNLRIDDTGSMVIEIMRQIKAEVAALKALGQSTKDIRTGINATGVYLETPNGKVILFFTGLHHAGEILDSLLRHRKPDGPKLVKVTDAASKNFGSLHEDRLIEGICNAHALLKFRDVASQFPDEYAVAGSIYKQVFENDDVAKAQGHTPAERLAFHRENSLPLMEKLKAMCEAKITNRLVEPNSKLWEPVTFIINQWPRLTKFCFEPGVPLDTNVVEQCLIMQTRYLAASNNYKTPEGAGVGDRHMSLIASARINGAEPVAYLEHCLRNHEDIKKRPEAYLPWAYAEQMKTRDGPPPQASRQPT
jgi:transposase